MEQEKHSPSFSVNPDKSNNRFKNNSFLVRLSYEDKEFLDKLERKIAQLWNRIKEIKDAYHLLNLQIIGFESKIKQIHQDLDVFINDLLKKEVKP